ncbi:unnamed protein product, partial [Trichobilharzia szidati]
MTPNSTTPDLKQLISFLIRLPCVGRQVIVCGVGMNTPCAILRIHLLRGEADSVSQ